LRKIESAQDGVDNILDVQKKVMRIIDLLDKKSKKSEDKKK